MSARDNRNVLRRGPTKKGCTILLRRFERYCAKCCQCDRGEGLNYFWGSFKPHMDPEHRLQQHFAPWLTSIHDTHIDILLVELQKTPDVNVKLLELIKEEVTRRCVDGMLQSNPETTDEHGRNYEDES